MPDSARFWDKRADGYAKSPIKDMESYERTLERARAHLCERDVALELGCGTGTTALRLAPSVRRLVATDLSTRMIEIAREKAAADRVEHVRFERATVFDDALEPGSFDVVLAFNLLHLLDDLPGALRRIHELLKPGGTFVSKTVCLAEQSRLWSLLLAVIRPLGIAPSVRCLKIDELEGIVTSAGFEIVEADCLPASPPSRFIVARRV